jgi:hypothetical protein
LFRFHDPGNQGRSTHPGTDTRSTETRSACFPHRLTYGDAITVRDFCKLSEHQAAIFQESGMKKLKHEAELFKGALLAGVKYAEGRKAVEFEPTDSASQKLLYIYRLLVHDKVIQPLPEDQVAEATMRHKLAIWYSKQLPKDHPLLR